MSTDSHSESKSVQESVLMHSHAKMLIDDMQKRVNELRKTCEGVVSDHLIDEVFRIFCPFEKLKKLLEIPTFQVHLFVVQNCILFAKSEQKNPHDALFELFTYEITMLFPQHLCTVEVHKFESFVKIIKIMLSPCMKFSSENLVQIEQYLRSPDEKYECVILATANMNITNIVEIATFTTQQCNNERIKEIHECISCNKLCAILKSLKNCSGDFWKKMQVYQNAKKDVDLKATTASLDLYLISLCSKFNI